MEELRLVDACTEEHFQAMSLIHALGWRDVPADRCPPGALVLSSARGK